MSQGVPSGLEGQIDSPNSLELWWDKNKRILIGIGIVLAIAIVANYAWQYMERRAADRHWSALIADTNLDAKWVDVEAAGTAQEQFRAALDRQIGLVSDLYEDLADADVSKLEKRLSEVRGDRVAEPLMLWFLANRAVASQSFADARKWLEELKSKFPDHFLVAASDYPLQWRARVDPKAEVKPNRAPELVDPEGGSMIDRYLARIDAEESFRKARAELYDAPEPDSDKVAIIEFESTAGFNDRVKIRFYASRAPKHYEAFLRLAEENFWDGVFIHHVERKGQNPSAGGTPSEFQFGVPYTRTEADVSKWTLQNFGDVAEDNNVEWEASGVSHFPGSLAALPARGGSQVERLAINGDDVADSKDETRVVFGRVVEGLEFIQRLIEDIEFSAETGDQVGRGTPGDRVAIKSITIEDA